MILNKLFFNLKKIYYFQKKNILNEISNDIFNFKIIINERNESTYKNHRKKLINNNKKK